MKDPQSRYILIIACIIFLFFGAVTGGIGPILPELAANTSSNLSAVGGVFTAIFLGALISQLISGPLNDRFGQKKVLFFSLLILAAGIIGFTSIHSLWIMLAVTFLSGLGHGSVDLSTNLLVARTFSHKNNSIMNLLHFFFGLGAFIGPALISLSMTVFSSGIVVMWLASGAMVVLAFLVLGMKLKVEQMDQNSQEQGNVSVYKSVTLWLLGGLLLLYVGVENGIGGWATSYMNTTAGMSMEKAALVSSGFWGALTLGRLVTTFIGSRFTQKRILMISLLSSSLFGLVFSLSTGNLVISIIGIVLIGFFFGTVYPTMVSLVTTIFKQSPGKATSVIAAMGSIGGMLIPWCQGYLLENVSPVSSTWFATMGIILMVVLLWIVEKIEIRTI